MATIASLDVVLDVKNRGRFKRDMTAVVASVVAAGVAFDQLMDKGGKVQPVMRAFGRRVGDQTVALSKLRTATMGLVSDYDLMQQANTAFTLGSASTIDEMATLASTAQRLGRALGVDAQMALNSLNTGIARQSRLLLDNIGLIVDTESANKKYAAQLGVNVSQLTEAQRKEAFRIETMEQARQKLSELGEETRTAADAWAGLKIEIGNTADALSTWVAGSNGTAGFLDGVTRDVRILTFELEQFLEKRAAVLMAADRHFGVGMPDVETGAVGSERAGLQRRIAEQRQRLQDAAGAATNYVSVLDQQVTPVLFRTTDATTEWVKVLQRAREGNEDAALTVQLMTDNYQFLAPEIDITTMAVGALAAATNGAADAQDRLNDKMQQFSAVMGGLSFLTRLPGLGFLSSPLSMLSGGVFSALRLDQAFGGEPEGRAHGGPVSGGTAYMVGERGPEMFVPRQSGTIIPNGGISLNVSMSKPRGPREAARDSEWLRELAWSIRELESNGFRPAT